MTIPNPVDNSVSATPAPAPAAPATEPTATPAAATETAKIDPRSPEFLNQILNGADPEALLNPKQPPVAAPAPQPAATPAPGTPVIPDKFKNPDGSVNTDALIKSYSGLEHVLGNQGNKIGELERQLREVYTKPAQPPITEPKPAEPAPPAPKMPWEREMSEEQKAKMAEEFYADPVKAMDAYGKQIAEAMQHKFDQQMAEKMKPLEPVVQSHAQNAKQSEFQEVIGEFVSSGKAPDFADYVDQMGQIALENQDFLDTLPMDKAIQWTYYMAKGMSAQAAPAAAPPPPPTFEQLLADPANLQKILSDPTIKNQVLTSYAQDLKANQPPIMIGGQPGGIPPAAGAERPKSVREASKMAAKYFSGGS